MTTLDAFLSEWHADSPLLTVHTSGSTGAPKPLLVEKRRMQASARITCQFLGLKAGDTALLCLPLDYIAGKMMVVRALTCGLRLVSVPPTGHPLAMHDAPCLMLSNRQTMKNEASGIEHDALSIDFAAMVPLQVWQSLHVPEERRRLQAIGNLIIGGGAVDDALARELQAFPNAVWSTYGMTETLSHIALRRLSGPQASSWYTPFEGVAVSLNAEGCLVIDAPAVHDGPLVTNDIAELKPQASNQFRILGRKDNVICSGGLKIQAEEVERLLAPHLQAPFCITRRHDPLLGEAVTLLTEDTDLDSIEQLCRQLLPRHWRPRHYLHTPQLPTTETGKVARREAEERAALQR